MEGGDVRWIGGRAVDRCPAEGIWAAALEGAGTKLGQPCAGMG